MDFSNNFLLNVSSVSLPQFNMDFGIHFLFCVRFNSGTIFFDKLRETHLG